MGGDRSGTQTVHMGLGSTCPPIVGYVADAPGFEVAFAESVCWWRAG